MKVWIVDDNFTNGYVLKEMLSFHSHIEELIIYTVPEELLRELSSTVEKPDVILADIMMPGMNGYDLSKNIKQSFPDIKIIGITALPKSRDLIDRVKTCGMEDIIFKPYDMRILIEYLKTKN